MLPRPSIFQNALLLTGIDLFLRAVSMSFQVYLSGEIGAAGLGLLQLLLSVGSLAMTLGLSGVRTAVLYLCAEEHGKHRFSGIRHAVHLCLLWTLGCSIVASTALWFLSDTLAVRWLHNAHAASGLRILGLSLPVRCFVSVLCGYFTACGKVRFLALVEIVQQLFSILLTYLLLSRLGNHVSGACNAILLADFGAALLGMLWLTFQMEKHAHLQKSTSIPPDLPRRVVRLCLPLALGDYLRSGLRTLEQLLIPLGLSRAAGSTESAMHTYGTVHAMVFPILLFPAALLNSLSDLLIPELARCHAEGNTARIRILTEKSLRFGILFSGAVAALEFLLSRPLGLLFYRSTEVGDYLRLFSPMIVILYLDSIVDGVCKGLGKQVLCARNNTLTSLLDVAMLYLLLPRLGINGYLLTFALTHILNFYLSLLLLFDASGCQISAVFLLKSVFCIFVSFAICLVLPRIDFLLGWILLSATVFTLSYCFLLYGTNTLSPADRRWIRRTLSRRKGR